MLDKDMLICAKSVIKEDREAALALADWVKETQPDQQAFLEKLMAIRIYLQNEK